MFLGIGSGALGWVHNLTHEWEDAALASGPSRGPAAPAPLHDEHNCYLHALLASPIISTAWVPLLVALGLFVAFVSQLSPSLASQRVPIRLDCRGPPVVL